MNFVKYDKWEVWFVHKSGWKFYMVGASAIIVTSVFSIFGVRASLYAIDFNQREAMIRIEQQANRMQAMQASMDMSELYGSVKPKASGDAKKGTPSKVNGKNQKDPFAAWLSENGTVGQDSSSSTPEVAPDEPKNRWEESYAEIQKDSDGKLFYVVQSGDTMMKIARQFGFSVTELAAYNHIANANRIYVGEQILFPENGPSDIGDPSVGLG